MDASHFSWSSGKKYGSSRCSLEDYRDDRWNKGAKGGNLPRPVNTDFSNALNINAYLLNKQFQKYDGRFSN